MFPCTEKDCDKEYTKKPSWTNIFRTFTKERDSSALAAVWASPSVADQTSKIIFYDMYVCTPKSRNTGALIRVA